MKKTLVYLGLALGLWGLTATRVQAQFKQIAEVFPWHIDTYEVTSTEGTFTDISTAEGVVALTTTENQLHKVMFHATSEKDATPTATKTTVFGCADDFSLSGFPLGFEFDLCNYKMTHFVVSATGGVYFNDSSLQGSYTSLPLSAGKWAVWTLPYVFKNATATATTMANSAGQIVQASGKTPAYYLIEGQEGNHVLTVQYDFMVGVSANATVWDEWIFQLKFYEATGKIDFIVKQLAADNAIETPAGKYHRILLSVTDFAATAPSIKLPGQATNLFVDPYGSSQMRILANGSNHKLYIGQTNAMSEADGWNSFTMNYDVPSGSDIQTMRVDANGPGEGRTISFTPQSAPQTADITPFTAQHYALSNEAITSSSYSADIVYTADMFPTATAFKEAGPIVAVISASETPDYTLENGTYYKPGHEFNEANGFKPQVIANQVPKPSVNWNANTWSWPSKDFAVNLKATGLKIASTYYIHLYRLAFTGTGAPVYSALCHTHTFATDLSAPKAFETVGLADIDGVTLKVEPAEGLSVLVVKSNTPNIKPSGLLKKGDKIGDAEVIELLSEEKTWKLPLQNGEGCFIVAFSVNTSDENNYIYAPTKQYIAVGTAYDGLPGVIDFTTLPYGVPNWEHNGINIRTQAFMVLEPTAYRDLPFGYTRSEMAGNKSTAFGIGQPAYHAKAPHYVYAKTEAQGDFITPPIVADKNRILVTFNTQWLKSDDGGNINVATVGGDQDGADYCAIEYAIGDGAWQKGVSFKGFDLPDREDGYFPVSFSLTADNDESFIGKKIRFRFKSTYTLGADEPSFFVGIGSIDIKEDRLCQSVNRIKLNEDLTTSTRLGLQWHDLNYPTAPSFEIAYRQADDAEGTWRTKKADDTVATIENLTANTTYAVKVTADCGGSWGKSYSSMAYEISTFNDFPFADDLAQAEPETIEVGGKPVTVAGKTPFEWGVTTFTGKLPDSGAASLKTPSYGWTSNASSAILVENGKRALSVGVRETEPTGWLLMPTAYIPDNGDAYPQIIRFKANCAHKYANEKSWTEGSIGSKYKNVKLYVLLSHNGAFAKKDTLAVIEVSGATIDHETYEFYVPYNLLKNGRAQVAFLFENPDASDAEDNEDAMLFEIYDFEYRYADNVCLPTGNLVRAKTTSNGTTFTWDGHNELYKIFWGPRDMGIYTDSAQTTGTTYTLTGLQEKTRYNVKVVGYCDEEGTEVAPNELTTWFQTLETCHMPEAFAVSGIGQTSVTFSSTNEQSILTQRLIYLTPQNDTATKIYIQTADELEVNGLLEKTVYTAQTRSVCDLDSSEMSEPITFTTLADSLLIRLNVLPNDQAGTVTGQGRYEKGTKATVTATPAEGYRFLAWLFGTDTVSTEAIYTFNVTRAGTYTAVFAEGTANENLLQAAFGVHAGNGKLYIRNLKGLTVEEVTVYGVTGRQIGRFTPNSREDLVLPVNAERAVLVVRVASEQGAATYKVYLH